MFGEQGMEHAEEYTYLGLVFHRSLGRTGGSGRLGKRDRFEGKEFYDGDTKEARVVVDIFDDQEYGSPVMHPRPACEVTHVARRA